MLWPYVYTERCILLSYVERLFAHDVHRLHVCSRFRVLKPVIMFKFFYSDINVIKWLHLRINILYWMCHTTNHKTVTSEPQVRLVRSWETKQRMRGYFRAGLDRTTWQTGPVLIFGGITGRGASFIKGKVSNPFRGGIFSLGHSMQTIVGAQLSFYPGFVADCLCQ